jgi:hypothetical protein
MGEENPTQLVLDGPADQNSVLAYEGQSANDFAVAYAYNDIRMRANKPNCSDLMMRFYVQPDSEEGRIGIALSKYGVEYRAWLDFSGEMVLTQVDGNQETVRNRQSVPAPNPGAFTLVKFANVDHQLLFEFDGNRLTFDMERFYKEDLDRSVADQQFKEELERRRAIPPTAALFGAGKLTVSHVALFRDIHYLSERTPRATEEEPFQLNADEFFVLGDNSPNSQDGRYWERPNVSSKGTEPPRAGVVPRYYLVGRALFVYWPSGFEFPWPASLKNVLARKAEQQSVPASLLYRLISLRWIPNIGQMRFIYGGTSGQDPPAPPAMAKGSAD